MHHNVLMALDSRAGSDNATLRATRLAGFRRGYGILPGALAALNAGGYSDVSAAWPSATMGKPNPARSLSLVYAREPAGGGGGELRLAWAASDWNGGYPLAHYALSLQRVSADSRNYVTVPLDAAGSTTHVAVSTADALANPETLPPLSYSYVGAASGEYRFGVIATNTMGDHSVVSWSGHVTIDRRGWCGLEEGDEGSMDCAGLSWLLGSLGATLLGCAYCCHRRAKQRGALLSADGGHKAGGGRYTAGITSSTARSITSAADEDEQYAALPRALKRGASTASDASGGLASPAPPARRGMLGAAAERVGLGGLLLGGGGGMKREVGLLYARLGELREALEHERSLREAAEAEKETYRIELESVASELGSNPSHTHRSAASAASAAAAAASSPSASRAAERGVERSPFGTPPLRSPLGSPPVSVGSSAAARLHALVQRDRGRDSPAPSVAGSTVTSEIELSLPCARPRATNPPRLQPPPPSTSTVASRAKIMPVGAPPGVAAPSSPTAGSANGAGGSAWSCAYGAQYDGDTPRPSPDERLAAPSMTLGLGRWGAAGGGGGGGGGGRGGGGELGAPASPATVASLSEEMHSSPTTKDDVKKRVADLIAQRAAERTAMRREVDARSYGTPFSPPGSAGRGGLGGGGGGAIRGAGALPSPPRAGIELATCGRAHDGAEHGTHDGASDSAASSCRSGRSDLSGTSLQSGRSGGSAASDRSDSSCDGGVASPDKQSLLHRQHCSSSGGGGGGGGGRRHARAASAGRSRTELEHAREERSREEARRQHRGRGGEGSGGRGGEGGGGRSGDSERELAELAKEKADLRRRLGRWEAHFEATHHRPPSDDDKARSHEFGELQGALRRRSQQLLQLSMSCGMPDAGVKSSPGREVARASSAERHRHRRSRHDPPAAESHARHRSPPPRQQHQAGGHQHSPHQHSPLQHSPHQHSPHQRHSFATAGSSAGSSSSHGSGGRRHHHEHRGGGGQRHRESL